MQNWAKIYNSMEVIQMSEDEIKSISSVLAAIFHLGVAGAVKGKGWGNTWPRSITPWK